MCTSARSISQVARTVGRPTANLPRTANGERFTLKDVFTYDRSIQLGKADARDLLMLFVLANAYLEGLLQPNSFFCVCPGSKRGALSTQLRGYLGNAASLVRGYYKEDLLVRASDSPDTSLERWRASRSGTRANSHTRYYPRKGIQINPYVPNTSLSESDFNEVVQEPGIDSGATAYFSDAISSFIARRLRYAIVMCVCATARERGPRLPHEQHRHHGADSRRRHRVG